MLSHDFLPLLLYCRVTVLPHDACQCYAHAHDQHPLLADGASFRTQRTARWHGPTDARFGLPGKLLRPPDKVVTAPAPPPDFDV